MFEERIFVKNGNTVKYLIDFPEDYDEKKKYPVMMYLHGSGFVKNGIDYLKEKCPMRRERVPVDKEIILVAPLCEELSWVMKYETVIAFIDYIIDSEYCNSKKVYLSGSSMGGFSVWAVLTARKQKFAAALICCGCGQYWIARRGAYNDIPIRLVHGKNDENIFPRESEIMYSTVKQAGGNMNLLCTTTLRTTCGQELLRRKKHMSGC